MSQFSFLRKKKKNSFKVISIFQLILESPCTPSSFALTSVVITRGKNKLFYRKILYFFLGCILLEIQHINCFNSRPLFIKAKRIMVATRIKMINKCNCFWKKIILGFDFV